MTTVARIAGEVAREWAAEGRVAVPPAVDSPEDDTAFWAEVERRAATEVDEAFNPHQPRYPRGHAKAGQWRPKLSTGAGRIAPGHLARDLDALKGLVNEVNGFYEGRNVLSHEINGIGLEVEKLALRYSARKVYEKRLADIRAERDAIQDRKWAEWEKLTPEEWGDENRDPDEFLGPGEAKRLRAIQDEEINLMRERNRADRDAMLGVLKELRPMGGTVRRGKQKSVPITGGTERGDLAAIYRDKGGAKGMLDDLDANLKEVSKVVPSAWLEDTNAKGEVTFELSTARAWASTTRKEPARPDDAFREMEDAVDAALKGDLGDKQTWRAAVDVMEVEGDPYPKGDEVAVDAWHERKAEVARRLMAQKYRWVGRAGSPDNPNYPKGLWAVVEGEDDKHRYYVNWGGDLSLIREPRETDSPIEKMNLSMPVREGKREDRRFKGPVPITAKQQQAIEQALIQGGSYEGLYDNRYPVVRRPGTEEGGVGPYAAIYDWIDDKGAAKNLHAEEVAPPGGFDEAKWDRNAPRPSVLPSTADTHIRIDPRAQATLLHELSHRLEVVYGEENRAGFHPIAMATRSWLDGRTVGEAAQKLQDLYPGYSYEDHEIAKPDKFVDGYVGKQYGGEVTEVLTMGMEMLWFPRYGERDINKDSGHRRLILGMLAAL